jgi:[glutamine synthetase] adenylyltransferase / [glutamine synthetase]-adenylyl-L-tyrosine phosphorylase
MAEPEIEPFILSLPDPQAARIFLQRLESQHPQSAASIKRDSLLLSRLLTIAAFSPFLGENLLRHPDDIDWFRRETERGLGQGKTTEQLSEDLSRFTTRLYDADARTLLVRFKNRELLRIYLRDCLNLATLAELTDELSNLADVILAYALKLAMQQVVNLHGSPLIRDERGRIAQAEFAIIALGKLGCCELNYASDIDLMFLYSGVGETAGDGRAADSVISNKEFFTRVAQLLIKTISGLSIEGSVYRVDLRLRPYGRDGDLVWEIARAADYYHQKAANWERQMLIRARAAAGNEAVFTGFFDLVRDVVFHQEPHPEAIADVRRAKDKIDRKVASQSGGFNVKLGPGGIREVEFIAQALQLAHGGREPWVRSAQTLIVLARLAEKGFLTEQERTALSSAYSFFRVVEHRLQMEHGAQTHTLPLAAERLELLARRCGYQTVHDFTALKFADALVNRAAAAAFQRDVESHAATVRSIYNRLLTESPPALSAKPSLRQADEAISSANRSSDVEFEPLTDGSDTAAELLSVRQIPAGEAAPLSQSTSAPEEPAQAPTEASGFDDEISRLIDQATTALNHLSHSLDGAEAFSALEPIIAEGSAAAINPVRSLKNLISWAESFATYGDETSQTLLRLMSEDLSAFLPRLIAIFSSQYLSAILVARPLLSSVLFETRSYSTTEDFLAVMRQAIDQAASYSDKADALRRVWYELILGIGSRDMTGVRGQASGVSEEASRSQESEFLTPANETSGPTAIDHRLRASNLEQTALAEAALQLAAEITLQAMGVNEALPLVIMGLGRLGHAGMDYGSDLDLLVVYDDRLQWQSSPDRPEPFKSYGTAQEFYADFTARLLKLLSSLTREGFIYRVDMRLRPDGKNGQLAQGLRRLLIYLIERASAWEYSAYLKVREVAGNLDFGELARQSINLTLFKAAANSPSLKQDLAAMRARLEKEKARGNRRDIKWGPGGMTDVYFITRFLQLHGRLSFPTEAGTLALVQHLGEQQLLDGDAASRLFAGYTFLRRLDHWMRLLLDRPTQVLPASQVALGDITRSLGFSSTEEFEREYTHHTTAIREVYLQVFS